MVRASNVYGVVGLCGTLLTYGCGTAGVGNVMRWVCLSTRWVR